MTIDKIKIIFDIDKNKNKHFYIDVNNGYKYFNFEFPFYHTDYSLMMYDIMEKITSHFNIEIRNILGFTSDYNALKTKMKTAINKALLKFKIKHIGDFEAFEYIGDCHA